MPCTPSRTVAASLLALPIGLVPPVAAQAPDLLKGPDVAEPTLPGVERSFGGEMEIVQGIGARRIPMRVFQKAVRSLNTHENADRHLTKEQRAGIADIERGFRNEVMAYFRDSGTTPREAAQTMRKLREAQQSATPADEKTMNELRTLQQEAPSPIDAQERILALLTDAQRKHVLASLEERTKPETQAEPDPKQMQEAISTIERMIRTGEVDLSMLPPRIAERLERVPERRRARALERILERLKGEQPTAPKPLPSMDQLEMPAP